MAHMHYRYKDKLLKKCFHPCVSSEQGKPNETKKLPELEPFTDYSCIGHIIKQNNVTIINTTVVNFKIDCGMLIFTLLGNNKLVS